MVGLGAGQHGQACQRSAGATVRTETANLNLLASTRPGKEVRQRRSQGCHIGRYAEVRPVDMVVGPRRLPSLVQVEPEVGCGLALVGSCRIEGDRCHARLIGQAHLTYMPMDLPWSMR